MVKLRGWLISHYKNDRPIDGKRPSVPRYPRPQDNFASPVPVHPSYPKQEKMASLQDFKVECIKYQKVISSNVCNNSGYVPEGKFFFCNVKIKLKKCIKIPDVSNT